MRLRVLVLVLLALVVIAVPAYGQTVESHSVVVGGLRVNRAYLFGMVTTNTKPVAQAVLVPTKGRSWPYLASLVMLGLLWQLRRRGWPSP